VKVLVAQWDSVSADVRCEFRTVVTTHETTGDIDVVYEVLTPDSVDWRPVEVDEKELMLVSLVVAMYASGGDVVVNKEIGESQIASSN